MHFIMIMGYWNEWFPLWCHREMINMYYRRQTLNLNVKHVAKNTFIFTILWMHSCLDSGEVKSADTKPWMLMQSMFEGKHQLYVMMYIDPGLQYYYTNTIITWMVEMCAFLSMLVIFFFYRLWPPYSSPPGLKWKMIFSHMKCTHACRQGYTDDGIISSTFTQWLAWNIELERLTFDESWMYYIYSVLL